MSTLSCFAFISGMGSNTSNSMRRFTRATTNNYRRWPAVASTGSAMTWKAVTKFELDTPLEELLVDDHTIYMMSADL